MSDDNSSLIAKFTGRIRSNKNNASGKLVAAEIVKTFHSIFEKLASDWNTKSEDKDMIVNVNVFRPDESGDVPWLMVSSSLWSLTVRASANKVRMYLIPSTHPTQVQAEESARRAKLTLPYGSAGSLQVKLQLDGEVLTDEELRFLCKSVFRDLVASTMLDAQYGFDSATDSQSLDFSMTRKMQQLVSEKHHLASKLVKQQETLQSEISRDMHDVVIGNLMAIKSIMKQRALDSGDLILKLDEVMLAAREICKRLYPRDLREWGLVPVVEDLLQSVAERSGAECDLDADDIPALDAEVELQIFRIIQECLNNIEKHANASAVKVSMRLTGHSILVLEIADDGTGISSAPEKTGDRAGGLGMQILRERADMISATYPTKLSIRSEPDRGTCVLLTIDLQALTSNGPSV
jgi:signal transduction histidine kinase